MKDIVIGGLVAVAIVISVLAFTKPVPFGANPSPEFFVPAHFRDTAIIGGGVFATTSNGTVVYTAASFQKTNVIEHTATGAVAASLPASTTLNAFLPFPGDTRTLFLRPITSAITVSGGTGTLLRTASTSKVCNLNQLCKLDFVRKSNTDIEVFMNSGTN